MSELQKGVLLLMVLRLMQRLMQRLRNPSLTIMACLAFAMIDRCRTNKKRK